VYTERRRLLIGKWAGEQGVVLRDNTVSAFGGMKTPILKAGGFGLVGSDEEFEGLLSSVKDEFDAEGNRSQYYTICWAQKPKSST
jgi:hypothetical protein